MSTPLERELDYHEKLYGGFAQSHFAKPAVRALREHMANRIVRVTGIGPRSRVLSIGCGIGDTELLLAPRVGQLTGVDLSPSAVRQANADAAAAGIRNFRAVCQPFDDPGARTLGGDFDAIIAIFFLHHLDAASLESVPAAAARMLRPGGVFYSLDPSRDRLSGRVGEFLFPQLMARYQSPNEQPLDAGATAALFRRAGLRAEYAWYDFASTPLAGLAPSFRTGYLAARRLDGLLTRLPWIKRWSSNFEIRAERVD